MFYISKKDDGDDDDDDDDDDDTNDRSFICLKLGERYVSSDQQTSCFNRHFSLLQGLP